MPILRRSIVSAVLLLVAVGARAEAPRLLGFVRLEGRSFDATPSWLDSGFGKLGGGRRPTGTSDPSALAEGRLALDFEPAVGWRLFVHGVAHTGDAGASSAGSGLLEAFAELHRGLGEGHELALRAGEFFLPTSRENVEPLWSSPYTLTLSALNTWIGEEVRPLGLDAIWSRTFADDHRVAFGATLFEGNDTAGVLLAWRGFALHDRPTPFARYLPLPPFPGAAERFPSQSRHGTQPFQRDLDGRPGFAGRAVWSAPDLGAGGLRLQATSWRNRGDRALHGDEYAWDTGFDWLGLDAGLPGGLRLVTEWGHGTSRMGAPSGVARAQVDIAFTAFYALLTREWGPTRCTVRYDRFTVRDEDRLPLDDNREHGSGWTAAALVRLGERWRVAVEVLDLEAERPAAARVGAPEPSGRSLRSELRFTF